MAEFNIKFNKKCITPIITDVIKVGTSITVKWDTVGIDSTASYTIQYSTDNGITYNTVNTFNSSLGEATVTLTLVPGIVKFKILSNATSCVNIASLPFPLTVNPSTIYITDEVTDGVSGSTTFKLHVEGDAFVGIVILKGEKDKWSSNVVVDANFGNPLYIPDSYETGDIAINYTSVTIPIGTHDYILSVFGSSPTHSSNNEGIIGFSYTSNFDDAICSINSILIITPF